MRKYAAVWCDYALGFYL